MKTELSVTLPAYIYKEAKLDPLPQIRYLIENKTYHLTEFNNIGLKLIDDCIVSKFDILMDQKRQAEAIDDIKKYTRGRKLTKEGLVYKRELEREERRLSPTLWFADLIVDKLVTLNFLNDEEISQLDESIEFVYGVVNQTVEVSEQLMNKYYRPGKELMNSAKIWLAGCADRDAGPRIDNVIRAERVGLNGN